MTGSADVAVHEEAILNLLLADVRWGSRVSEPRAGIVTKVVLSESSPQVVAALHRALARFGWASRFNYTHVAVLEGQISTVFLRLLTGDPHIYRGSLWFRSYTR